MTTQSLADVLYTGPKEPRLVKCEEANCCRARTTCPHVELHEYNQNRYDWGCGFRYCDIADAVIKCQEPTPKK